MLYLHRSPSFYSSFNPLIDVILSQVELSSGAGWSGGGCNPHSDHRSVLQVSQHPRQQQQRQLKHKGEGIGSDDAAQSSPSPRWVGVGATE